MTIAAGWCVVGSCRMRQPCCPARACAIAPAVSASRGPGARRLARIGVRLRRGGFARAGR